MFLGSLASFWAGGHTFLFGGHGIGDVLPVEIDCVAAWLLQHVSRPGGRSVHVHAGTAAILKGDHKVVLGFWTRPRLVAARQHGAWGKKIDAGAEMSCQLLPRVRDTLLSHYKKKKNTLGSTSTSTTLLCRLRTIVTDKMRTAWCEQSKNTRAGCTHALQVHKKPKSRRR